MEQIQFIVGAIFFFLGICVFLIEIYGVFRFKYVLNRMHAAALGDTLGIALCFLGLMIISGFNFTTLKLFMVIVFLWFSSPTSSHLIARLEVTTNEDVEKHYEEVNLDERRKSK